MDPEKKSQLDAAVGLVSAALTDAMKEAGFTEHILLGARLVGPEGAQFDVFAKSDCSTMTMANMFLFLFDRMNDESVGKLLTWLSSQPSVAAKMCAWQSKQMAEMAERMRAQAAASPEPAQPAPAVPDTKNKSWLN